MKTAARIWLIATLTECLIYPFIFKDITSIPVVGIIALVCGFPGMLVLAFGIELVHIIWEKAYKKWWAIALITFFAANGSLCLFLYAIGADFNRLDLPYFPIVNIAALSGFLCSLSGIRKRYFSPLPEPLDVTHQSSYQFNTDNDKN